MDNLDLKRAGEDVFWILSVDEVKLCFVCSELVREGYFCPVSKKVYHKDCFKLMNFDCGKAWQEWEHQDYCVVVKTRKEQTP